jgi:hypothetical protein
MSRSIRPKRKILGTLRIIRPLERAGSVPDEFGFMMARTANQVADFLISLLG